MSVISVTSDELDTRQKEAKAFVRSLDELLKSGPIRTLMAMGKIRFAYHPWIASGRLGDEMKTMTEQFVHNGALDELIELLDSSRPGGPIKFIAGNLGSVWADVELTGGIGANRRTKLVRLTPSYSDGAIDIMLDNTFDDKW